MSSSPPRKILRQTNIMEHFQQQQMQATTSATTRIDESPSMRDAATLDADDPTQSFDVDGQVGVKQALMATCESPDMFASNDSDDTETLSEILIHRTEVLETYDETTVMDTEYRESSACLTITVGKTLEVVEKFDEKNEEVYPVAPNHCHQVLFQVTMVHGQKPQPFPQYYKDTWDDEHVRMPCSSHSIYPVEENGRTVLKERWRLIQAAYEKPISSCEALEQAVLSYNSRYSDRWDFGGLRYLIDEIFSESERQRFFSSTLPGIVSLALRLPIEVTSSIPLLLRRKTASLSLNQLQIACLLANAFLCTFPRRNTHKKKSEFSTFPEINFIRLFENKSRGPHVYEKIKCLLHYFDRVIEKEPTGVVTFTRKVIPEPDLPRWETLDEPLRNIVFLSEGTIEKDGAGLLQIDFANRFIGGGVLGWGCVQEEIRFVICPELIAACLFTESAEKNEAIVITGCEQYCQYSGYSGSFKFDGDYVDPTPVDVYGRKMTTVVAIDAARFHWRSVQSQYKRDLLTRELNKAFVGFYCPRASAVSTGRLAAVATGNWGCGAFRGDPRLKCLIQSMAASLAGRDMVYFTFFDEKLKKDLEDMHLYLKSRKVSVGTLFQVLCQYGESYADDQKMDLYGFLYAYFDTLDGGGDASDAD